MSLRQRVGNLERFARLAAMADTCAKCGYPARAGRGVVILGVGDELAECELCSGPLDREGHPLGLPGKHGERTLRVIVIRSGSVPVFPTLESYRATFREIGPSL